MGMGARSAASQKPMIDSVEPTTATRLDRNSSITAKIR